MSENTRYFIIAASKDHVQFAINGNFGQACKGKKFPLESMKKGDYIIYYSGKSFYGKMDKCQHFT